MAGYHSYEDLLEPSHLMDANRSVANTKPLTGANTLAQNGCCIENQHDWPAAAKIIISIADLNGVGVPTKALTGKRFTATWANTAETLITAAEREQAGKPAQGALELQFGALPDGTFDLRFQDDGRGVDPALVRRIAIERGLITADVAQRLRDRQTIKLIFKDGFTSLASTGTGPDSDGAAHGAGLSLVRRYVHDAGGKVALASDPGKETRFKVSLPEIVKDAAPKQAEVA